jgi:hypothetical protein
MLECYVRISLLAEPHTYIVLSSYLENRRKKRKRRKKKRRRRRKKKLSKSRRRKRSIQETEKLQFHGESILSLSRKKETTLITKRESAKQRKKARLSNLGPTISTQLRNFRSKIICFRKVFLSSFPITCSFRAITTKSSGI